MKNSDKQRWKQWVRHWWRALCWAALLYFFSTGYFNSEATAGIIIPILQRLFPNWTPETFFQIHYLIRKTAHFLNYFLLSILVLEGLRGEDRGWRWVWGRRAVLLCTAYAALDEFHQSLVPWRGASPYDVLLDGAGSAVAQLVAMLWYRLSKPVEREAVEKDTAG
jgi:VanZ family protein